MSSKSTDAEEEISYGARMELLKRLCDEGSLERFRIEAAKLTNGDESEGNGTIANSDSDYADYVHYRWPHGETILHWAAASGFDDLCAYLVSIGAYINAENMHGCSPLFYASRSNKVSTVQLLLSLGADFDCTSSFSNGTPYEPVPPEFTRGEPSAQRLEIQGLIRPYQAMRELFIRQSPAFKDWMHTVQQQRLQTQREVWLQPTTHGGQHRIGYWGLTDISMNPELSRNDDKKNDMLILFFHEQSHRWCRSCLRQAGDGTDSDTQDGLLRCSRCKECYYCNTDCQRVHWPHHSKLCKSP